MKPGHSRQPCVSTRDGPSLSFAGVCLRAKAEAAKPARAGPRRLASAVGPWGGRLRCGLCACKRKAACQAQGSPQWAALCPGTLRRIPGPAGNSLRSLRSLRSDTPALKSVVDARCARGPGILRSSPPQMRAAGLPGPALQQQRWRTDRPATMGGWRGERCPLRVSRESARSAGIGRSARSAPRELTPRGVFERRERSERSELPRGRPMPSIAAQSAPPGADRRAPNPQRAPLAAPAATDARKSGRMPTSATGRKRSLARAIEASCQNTPPGRPGAPPAPAERALRVSENCCL